jgi:hypothetical protein
MTEKDVPEVTFDLERAFPIYPRPELKNAVLIMPPVAVGGGDLITSICPEWGGVQSFLGDFYAIVREGVVVYGSAKDQWENMHEQIMPGYWVKTAVPLAYQATERCRIITLVPNDLGGIRETSFTIEASDWIVRQPGGEIQHIKQAKYSTIYFTDAEVWELGLTNISAETFKKWASGYVKAHATA